MPSHCHPVTERAQPWLGTFVAIRVGGVAPDLAHRAIAQAYARVAHIHRRMSFHDAASDVARVNCNAAYKPIPVDPDTFAVLQWALRIAAASEGCFDISVASHLVKWGLLPRPEGTLSVPSGGNWRDIELTAGGCVRFHRPLWIDLGGIAKGYAVDCAAEILRRSGVEHGVVNAGGDLRVLGNQPEQVALNLEHLTETAPVVEVSGGSLASSSGHLTRRLRRARRHSALVHGVRRSPSATDRFVCVAAERCVVADALTKVAVNNPSGCAPVLREFGASAYIHDIRAGWSCVA